MNGMILSRLKSLELQGQKRVEKLEGVLNFKLNDGPIANHSKRIADLEETAEALSETVDQSTLSAKMFLERVTDIEILKTQMIGMVRDVDTLKIRQENTSPRLKALMDEVIAQKAFLAKVQAILDRERDARLVNSPSHKKEVEALKQDQKPKSRLKTDKVKP